LARIDRYMLAQLTLLFGFFALVLVAVYWINHAVRLFDELIADGHSARVFLEFTALSLPQIIALVLPMAAFVAAVYVTNRAAGDSELTVVQATGFSAWRVARPVLAFGAMLALLASMLVHLLVPAAADQLQLREREISGSVSARLLREGVFLHPARGVTFYIREISPEGELRDVFLSDLRDPRREITYTAERAYLIRDESGPKLVMVDGLAQSFNAETNQLATTNYREFVQDVSALVLSDRGARRKLEYVSSWQLITEPERSAEEARRETVDVWQELHRRASEPLLIIVAALIGQSALLAGGFSRFGVARQVVLAVVLLVAIKLVEGAARDVARDAMGNWPLYYLPALVGLGFAAALYWRADHPHTRLLPRRARTAPPEDGDGAGSSAAEASAP
jgi:lipopolysaccharide export system permease protein